MTTVAELVKTSTTTPAPEPKVSLSTVAVAQSVVQNVSKKLTEAIQRSTEVYAENKNPVVEAQEPKKTFIDEPKFINQMSGQILKLDPSQPIYEDDSHVFVYFMLAMLICAVGYIMFHNKRKILALLIEGRQPHHSDIRRSGGVNYKRLNTEPPGVSVA